MYKILSHTVGGYKYWFYQPGYHAFSTYAKFSEKLTLTNILTLHTCASQGVRNLSYSENFVYVINGWSLEEPIFDIAIHCSQL